MDSNPRVLYKDVAATRYRPLDRARERAAVNMALAFKVLTPAEAGFSCDYSVFVVWDYIAGKVYLSNVYETAAGCRRAIAERGLNGCEPALVLNELDRAMDPTGERTLRELEWN